MTPNLLFKARTPALLISILMCVSASQCSLRAQESDNSIQIGERHSLKSTILKEDRPYLIYLPQSYRSKDFAPKRYPVLYLLDGDAHFQSASGVVQFMTEGPNLNRQAPELILVAIPSTARMRDLTPSHTTKSNGGKEAPFLESSGGGEAFLRFLSEELIPRIEADYRTEPYRILAGHSLGGLFAAYAFLQRPQIFQALIAMDPSLFWDHQFITRQAKEMLQRTNDFRGMVYISEANNPAPEGLAKAPIREATDEFAELLRAHHSEVFRSQLQFFEDEDHGSVPLLSLYHGLLFIFDGFKPKGLFNSPPDKVSEHFAKVSDRLGYRVLPPEELVNLLAWLNLEQLKKTNAALDLLQLNVTNYPASPNARVSLAEAYDKIGEKPLALEQFRSILKDDPQNRGAARGLRRLKPAAEKARGPLADGTYRLIHKPSGNVLEVPEASDKESVPIQVGKYLKGRHQQWQLKGQGDGYYEITALHSGLALNVSGASTLNGASVIQWPVSGEANEIWRLVGNRDGTYRLLNEHSELALEVASRAGTNSPTVQQWEWRGLDSQRWRIKAVPTPSK